MPPQCDRGDYTTIVDDPVSSGRQHSHFGADQAAVVVEPVRRPSTIRRKSFIQEFASSNGPPQIVVLCMLLALGLGSTIGVVSAHGKHVPED